MENLEQFAEKLSNKLEVALNKTNKVIPERKRNIEYFFSFENNKVKYYFLVPGCQKEDLKLTIENDINDNSYANLILTKNSIYKNFKFAQGLENTSFAERKVEQISLVKESFDFENIDVKLNNGILELTINIKNKEQNTEKNREFFIVKF